MKTPLLILALLLAANTDIHARSMTHKPEDSVSITVGETSTPLLLDRSDNELFHIRIDAPDGGTLDGMEMTLDPQSARYVKQVKLYYGGTDARSAPAGRLAPADYIPDGSRAAEPSYSLLLASRKGAERISLDTAKKLFRGINYLWVSIEMKSGTPLTHKLSAAIRTVAIDGSERLFDIAGRTGHPHRMAVGVRHADDDGAAAYRIPGIVTTSRRTLLAVYDVRHNSSKDLQQHIDIGLSRSTDGGRTWERMRLPLSFAREGSLPAAQNGVGDPSILYDHTTHRAWIVAAWCHGMGYGMAWNNSAQGMGPDQTGQLVLAYSDDDGKTWSAPINITPQVKRPEWHFLLQGPGRGITMRDGTLVFPTQYIDADRIPRSAIMYSRDSGRTWHMHKGARANTTEAQVAELPTGELMLNMRDNRGGSRAVAITRDLGATWKEHPSSRKALREPVCMASLISVAAADNASGRDILLFSNPDSGSARRDITVKVSFDNGNTWPAENQVLLDGGDGWGYSCLTMIDPETVGILYESSQAHITFQAIPLADLLP